MKILFLCGSLEPGRDGVGDYTRRLANYLKGRGHDVSLLGLNDKYITESFHGMQMVEEVELQIVRLPFSMKSDEKCSVAKKWIDTFDPDWMSLQYVIYAFHNKGLPIGLDTLLERLGRGRNWHIMFHELWIGMAVNDTFKRKVWGRMQKFLIGNLIKKLNPKVIHTQCDLFLEQLKREKYSIKKLPLFSNIDVRSGDLIQGSDPKDVFHNKYTVKFVFYGGLHPEAKLSELIEELKKIARMSLKTFEFLYIGRNGEELTSHLHILDREKVMYKVLGELDPKAISYFLSVCSFGVSTGSPQMLQKNSTVASMLAHKLPIICIGRNLVLNKNVEGGILPGIYFLGDLEQLLLERPVINPSNRLPDIANEFINDLLLSA